MVSEERQIGFGVLLNLADGVKLAEHIWVMDRGVPTEAVLEEMRESKFPVRYLVGTPRGKLTRYEPALSSRPG